LRATSGNVDKSPLPKAYLDNLLESKKNKKNSALAKIIKDKGIKDAKDLYENVLDMKNIGNSVLQKNEKDKKEIEEFIKLYESYT
jgi:hypothetical protein